MRRNLLARLPRLRSGTFVWPIVIAIGVTACDEPPAAPATPTPAPPPLATAPPAATPETSPPPGAGMPPPGATGTIGLGSMGLIGHGSTPVAHVRTATPTVSGDGVSPAAIRRVVHRRFADVRACYEAQLEHAPDLGGRLAMTWVIEATGATSGVRVEASTLTSTAPDDGASARAVAICVTEIIAGATFPAPTSGTVTVTYPFVFDPPGVPPSVVEGLEPYVPVSDGDGFEGLGLHGTGRGGS